MREHCLYHRCAMMALCTVFITLVPAVAQHEPNGHELWHDQFYRLLVRADGFPCCTGVDCRPTTGKVVGDHYEVLVKDEHVPEGVWLRYQPAHVVKKPASPDGGWHVCAPKQWGHNLGKLYCVVMPSEA